MYSVSSLFLFFFWTSYDHFFIYTGRWIGHTIYPGEKQNKKRDEIEKVWLVHILIFIIRNTVSKNYVKTRIIERGIADRLF